MPRNLEGETFPCAECGVDGLDAPLWHKGRTLDAKHRYGFCYQTKWQALAAFAYHNSDAIQKCGGLDFKQDEASFDATNYKRELTGTPLACVTIGDALWESLQPKPGTRRTESAPPGARPAWCIADIDVNTLNENPIVAQETNGFRLPDHVVEGQLTEDEKAYWEAEAERRKYDEENGMSGLGGKMRCADHAIMTDKEGEHVVPLRNVALHTFIVDSFRMADAAGEFMWDGDGPTADWMRFKALGADGGVVYLDVPKIQIDGSVPGSKRGGTSAKAAAGKARVVKKCGLRGLGGLGLTNDEHVLEVRYYLQQARQFIDKVIKHRNDSSGRVDCDVIHEPLDKAISLLDSAYEHLHVSIQGERDPKGNPIEIYWLHRNEVLDYRALRNAIAKQHDWFSANCVRR